MEKCGGERGFEGSEWMGQLVGEKWRQVIGRAWVIEMVPLPMGRRFFAAAD
jgi:hypothetical protein